MAVLDHRTRAGAPRYGDPGRLHRAFRARLGVRAGGRARRIAQALAVTVGAVTGIAVADTDLPVLSALLFCSVAGVATTYRHRSH